MSHSKVHDLYDFMVQASVQMSAEYERIQKRATEDPGTAGDQGEENWASLLRDWLPRSYEVVTKGRIISPLGVTSRQFDVLVLTEAYPKRLLSTKLYLAAGVAAAFECKTTLKASHVGESLARCAEAKNLYPQRVGSPYRELHSPLIFGLLAHSHSWTPASTPEQRLEEKLHHADENQVVHPRLQLDVLCVADLATWSSSAYTAMGPQQGPGVAWGAEWGLSGLPVSGYFRHGQDPVQGKQFTPIGALISYLTQRLAWENPPLRPMADYYRITGLAGMGRAAMRTWSMDIYSRGVRDRVSAGELTTGMLWDEWSLTFC